MPETAKKAAPKTDATTDIWARLAEPFPAEHIEKLPKPIGRDGEKGRCEDTPRGRSFSADGHYCGGWHSRAVHLDYVGHAGITMRLNSVVGPDGWDFKPYALDSDGMPIMARDTFYATLTIAGVTKWDMAHNFKSPQEALGDALRRCAMRFGIGTYLWSKSEASFNMAKATDDHEPEPPRQQREQRPEDAPGSPPVGTGRAPHVQKVVDILASMPDAQKRELGGWWEREQKAGNLPPRTNLDLLRPETANWVDEVASGIMERHWEAENAAAEAAQAAQGPQ